MTVNTINTMTSVVVVVAKSPPPVSDHIEPSNRPAPAPAPALDCFDGHAKLKVI